MGCKANVPVAVARNTNAAAEPRPNRKGGPYMSTLVLVGDSVFDNAAYVNGPDVRAQVGTKMPDDWAVSLLAVDGPNHRGPERIPGQGCIPSV